MSFFCTRELLLYSGASSAAAAATASTSSHVKREESDAPALTPADILAQIKSLKTCQVLDHNVSMSDTHHLTKYLGGL